jgi:hypothetical protein
VCFDDAGRALTLRSTLAYRTLDWHHLAAYAEFEDVRDLGFSGDHNNGGAGSLGNGVSDRPVIADPAITELHQAFLDWQPTGGLSLRGGRQEVIFDNARLVGNVAWRQNHQGFDGVVARYSGVPRLKLAFASRLPAHRQRRLATDADQPPRRRLHLRAACDRPRFLSISTNDQAQRG